MGILSSLRLLCAKYTYTALAPLKRACTESNRRTALSAAAAGTSVACRSVIESNCGKGEDFGAKVLLLKFGVENFFVCQLLQLRCCGVLQDLHGSCRQLAAL